MTALSEKLLAGLKKKLAEEDAAKPKPVQAMSGAEFMEHVKNHPPIVWKNMSPQQFINGYNAALKLGFKSQALRMWENWKKAHGSEWELKGWFSPKTNADHILLHNMITGEKVTWKPLYGNKPGTQGSPEYASNEKMWAVEMSLKNPGKAYKAGDVWYMHGKPTNPETLPGGTTLQHPAPMKQTFGPGKLYVDGKELGTVTSFSLEQTEDSIKKKYAKAMGVTFNEDEPTSKAITEMSDVVISVDKEGDTGVTPGVQLAAKVVEPPPGWGQEVVIKVPDGQHKTDALAAFKKSVPNPEFGPKEPPVFWDPKKFPKDATVKFLDEPKKKPFFYEHGNPMKNSVGGEPLLEPGMIEIDKSILHEEWVLTIKKDGAAYGSAIKFDVMEGWFNNAGMDTKKVDVAEYLITLFHNIQKSFVNHSAKDLMDLLIKTMYMIGEKK